MRELYKKTYLAEVISHRKGKSGKCRRERSGEYIEKDIPESFRRGRRDTWFGNSSDRLLSGESIKSIKDHSFVKLVLKNLIASFSMDIKARLNKYKNRFIEIWEFKIFRYAIILHISYFILAAVLVLGVFRDQNDFLVFYQVGGVFLKDISDLYNQSNYLWDFRYFPLSAIFFIPFYLMGFDAGFIVFHIFNLFINILICIILYKIILLIKASDHENNEKRIITYISVYLMALPQMFNYVLGQINIIITFLMILSLYIFIKYKDIKWEFLASFILGISILIKPITIFLIPFLIVFNYDIKQKKVFFDLKANLVRLIGVALPLSLNIIVALFYPNLVEGFIVTNFTRNSLITTNASFSITRLFVNFFLRLT